MSQQLEDWQLALLVESRRKNDPAVMEAAEAEEYRDHKNIIDDAKELESPVVIERDESQKLDRADALLNAAAGIDDPAVVESDDYEALQEAADAASEAFSEALMEHHNLRDSVVESMGLPAMVSQFRDEDDDGGTISLEALTQQPETGGLDEGEEVEANDGGSGGSSDPDEDPIESLSAAERNEVREKLEKADLMESRTPDYADSLRAEAAEIAGLESADDIKTEAL